MATKMSGVIQDVVTSDFVIPKWAAVNSNTSSAKIALVKTVDDPELASPSLEPSKFRDQIVEAAVHLVKALPKKKKTGKRAAVTSPAAPTKRSVPAEFDDLEADQERSGHLDCRAAKKCCYTGKTDVPAILSNIATSKLNSLANRTNSHATSDNTVGIEDDQPHVAPTQPSKPIRPNRLQAVKAVATHEALEPRLFPPPTKASTLVTESIVNHISPSEDMNFTPYLSPMTPKLSISVSSVDTFDFIDGDDTIFDDIPDPSAEESKQLITPQSSLIDHAPPQLPHPAMSLSDRTAAILPTSASQNEPMKPFIRQERDLHPFPILTNIPTLTTTDCIRTFFRIADILRLQSSLPSAGHTTVELYAYAMSVSQRSKHQTVKFADLFFPDKPPFMIASYASWLEMLSGEGPKRIRMKHQDNEPPTPISTGVRKATSTTDGPHQFSMQPKMCRAIIHLSNKATTPNAAGPGLLTPSSSSLSSSSSSSRRTPTVEILNLRDADWDDVRYVRGIIEPEHQVLSVKSGKMEMG